MPGDPHSGSKVWKAQDREISNPGENQGRATIRKMKAKRESPILIDSFRTCSLDENISLEPESL
jgi:hypothetical protein